MIPTPPILGQDNGTVADLLDPQVGINMGSAVDHLPCFKDLIAVLFECFLIISLGYLSCRFKLVSTEARDLNSYLTTFALPTIIFLNIAQMEFQTINLTFIACMFAAKLLILILVTILTLTISYPTNFGYAGSLSILATQSNDFALGYPLIKSLYGEEKREMLTYLSLMAPIQLLIINPLGIVLLEYEKSRRLKRRSLDVQYKSPLKCRVCNANGLSPEVAQQSRNERQLTVATAPLIVPSNTPVNDLEAQANSVLRRRSCSTTQRPDMRGKQSDGDDSQEAVVPLARRKNINSLVLVMPARNNVIDTGSEGSVHPIGQTLDAECKLVYYGNDGAQIAQQTRGVTPPSPPHLPQQTTTVPNQLLATHANLPTTLAVIDGQQTALRFPCECQSSDPVRPAVGLSFLTALATNPLIIASVVALVVNLTYGPELPKLVTRVSNTVAASFAAPALFIVGLSMYGKFELLLKNPNDLLLASSIVLTKELILPNLMRTLTSVVLPTSDPTDENSYLIDFSFLYGLLPIAPTACIIAKQYGVLPNVVSISMLLSIITSAPLMLASAVIINPSSKINVKDIESVIAQTMKFSSAVTLFLAPVTLYTFCYAKRSLNYTNLINVTDTVSRRIEKIKRSPMQVFLFMLAVSQALIGLGGFTWFFVDSDKIVAHLPNSIITEPLNDTTRDTMQLNLDAIEKLDNTFRMLSCIQYVVSSSGLMMARFSIFCIIIIMAATRFRDLATAKRVSSLLLLVAAPLGVCTMVVLLLDADQQHHSAVDPSLPAPTKSLYMRLVYNLIFLLVSIPLFAMIIRSYNKSKKLTGMPVADLAIDNPLDASLGTRRFVTSTVSLTSDTSSALTINTNLDASINSIQCPTLSSDTNNNPVHNDTVAIDTKSLDQTRRPVSPLEGQSINPVINMFGTYGSTAAENQRCEKDPYESDDLDNNLTQTSTLIRISEFNRYSILAVFMLINSILNMTSIIQKLVGVHEFGTFRQIEVLGVSMEFGQGLLTFLIYGIRGVFR